MQKIKVKITGSKVHDVGYRVFLVNKALSFGVNNFNTFNTYINDTQTIIAIIEGDVETVEDFKNFVTAFMPKGSIVENISFEEYKNTVPPIERVMQAFQMEQWGKGIPILLQMLDKQDQTLGKQDQMLGKLDI
jgi:acylphosphatase